MYLKEMIIRSMRADNTAFTGSFFDWCEARSMLMFILSVGTRAVGCRLSSAAGTY
jgi:hypothetical protein